MKVLLAGGGTGGHINPAIAIANTIKEHDKSAEIAFIGTKKGMENKLVGKAGYPLYHIEMQGLRRSLSLSNIKTAYYYFTAPGKAKKLLLEYKPDVVVGTGGYLCWPLLHAASKLGIPTAVHESNAIPGKAVKMLEKEVDRIYINFPTTAEYFTETEKILCVGNPLITMPSTEAETDLRERLDIPKNAKKILLSFGGSLGAERVNKEVLALMRDYTSQNPDIFHIHATGKIEYEDAMAMAESYGLLEHPNIRLLEYIYDMPLWEKAADAVICRAGAMTIAEMALLGKACILIPSPNVANNHQYENAKRLAEAGAAIMHEEKDISTEKLTASVSDILFREETAANLKTAISAFAKPSACTDIYKDLQMLASKEFLEKFLNKTKH
ncbi:MAG: undecaprenyldiphospho-muramoylpentapeptide beta-N-acetylglucosaminyltransferase [Clostridia bacterium]|nr:undecaprenyldiphospho-muramoylpentapeptide beta-N-acetylglucosaminyltransferase [Clostridia bacterium]